MMDLRTFQVEGIAALNSSPPQPPRAVIGSPPPIRRWDLIHARTSTLLARVWTEAEDERPASNLWTFEAEPPLRDRLPRSGVYLLEGSEPAVVLAARHIAALVDVL